MEDKKPTAMDIATRYGMTQRKHDNVKLLCPRCGRNTMDLNLYRNALSRRADVYICSDCDGAEALADYFNVVDDLNNWDIAMFANV